MDHKKRVSIVLLALAALWLSGCSREAFVEKSDSPSREQAQVEDSQEAESSGAFTTKIKGNLEENVSMVPYLIQNNLQVETIEEEDQGKMPWKMEVSYPQILGLKNKTVEKKVNARIKAAVRELKQSEPGPYRGLHVFLESTEALLSTCIYGEVQENTSNVLSIALYRDRSYSQSDEEGQRGYNKDLVDLRCLNFDLNTGKELKFQDLFQDGDDGLDRINRYGEMVLSGGEEETESDPYLGKEVSQWIRLVQSFQGFSKDQKFLMGHGYLQLIVDYDTPQFVTEFRPEVIHVPWSVFGQSLAWPTRFQKKSSLFVQEEPRKSLFISGEGIYKHQCKRYTAGNFQVEETQSLPVDSSHELKQKVQELMPLTRPYVADLNRRINTLKKRYPLHPWGQGYLACDVTVRDIGNYFNASSYRNKSMDMPKEAQQEKERAYDERGVFRCYKKENLQEIQLEDLFVPGYEYKPVMRQILQRRLEERGVLAENGGEDKVDPKDLAAIIEAINGLQLGESDFSCSYSDDLPCRAYLLDGCFDYALFGDENIALFQD